MNCFKTREKIKVLVSYRVLQSWRLPVFIELDKFKDIELRVLTSYDFPSTKVINCKNNYKYEFWKILFSLNFFIKREKGNICIPFSPLFLFEVFKFKPDLIITEGLSNLFNNLQCFIYSKISDIPLLQWGLGDLPINNRSRQMQLIKDIFGKYESLSTGALAYSTHSANYYQQVGLQKSAVSVIYNSVNIDKRKDEILNYFKINQLEDIVHINKSENIVYLGALEKNKRVDILLIFFSEILKVRPQTNLLIIGDGNEKTNLIEYVKSNSIPNVTFIGNVSNNICRYLCISKVLVLPSLGGLVFTEALVHGIPVICGPADGSERDLLIHQSDFILNESMSIKNLSCWVNFTLKLLNDEELCKHYTINGFKLLKKLGSYNYANRIRKHVFKTLKRVEKLHDV